MVPRPMAVPRPPSEDAAASSSGGARAPVAAICDAGSGSNEPARADELAAAQEHVEAQIAAHRREWADSRLRDAGFRSNTVRARMGFLRAPEADVPLSGACEVHTVS